MAENSKISWTTHTFNPWMGCTPVSDGCRNCYARDLTKNRMGLDLWGDDKCRKRTKTTWNSVRKWNRSAAKGTDRPRVFVGSLMDVFEDRPELDEVRAELYAVVHECQNLDFLFLTKRIENVERLLPSDWSAGYGNVWLGVTIESNKYKHRCDVLRTIPSLCRFISYEPALGPLDLNLSEIDWVIYGGESGKNAHDKSEWALSMKQQCDEQKTAFYFKQRAGTGPAKKRHWLDGEIIQNLPKPSRKTTPRATE